METTTDRMPSPVSTGIASATQVRADVARAVAGLEAWHGEITRRRRELEDEDRQLEELELALTGQMPTWKTAPAVTGNGVVAQIAVREGETEAAAGMEARDRGHEAPPPPDGPATELGQDGPAATPTGPDGRQHEARHEAAASSVVLDVVRLCSPQVDEHFEAMFLESQSAGEPDDDDFLPWPDRTAPATVTEEMPAGGGGTRPRLIDCVADWRNTTMRSLIALTVKPRWMDSLSECLQDLSIESVGDLCTFLTDEGKELDDITTIPGERAELRRAMEAFRAAQGWDDATTYPAGIPGGWFEGEEAQDVAAIVAETASRPGERPSGDASGWVGMFAGKKKPTGMSDEVADGKPSPPGAAKKRGEMPREVVIGRLTKALDPKWSRWELLRQNASGTGTSDSDLMDEIGKKFAKRFRGEDWSATVTGGDPKWWATKSGVESHKRPTLEGPELCAASRSILEIPPPNTLPLHGGGKGGGHLAPHPSPEPDVPRPGRVARGKATGKKPPPAPGVLPPGGPPWTRGSLSAAKEKLEWRSSSKSLFVCDGCATLYLSDVRGTNRVPITGCPGCDWKSSHTYADEETMIDKRESGGKAKATKPDRAAEMLADTSHGFAASGKDKPKKKPDNVWGDSAQVGNIKLAERAPRGSLNRELARALSLDHPYHGEQWAKLQRSGATNAEILTLLKSLWPFAPVFTPPEEKGFGIGYTIQGGKNVGFWQGTRPKDSASPTWDGDLLASHVRALLGIKQRAAGIAANKPAKSKPTAPKKRPVGRIEAAGRKSGTFTQGVKDHPVPRPTLDDHFVPEPIGYWSIVKMSEAGRELLGETGYESDRDTQLVCCDKCGAMRARLTFPCPPCGSESYKSFALLRAQVLGLGKRTVEKSLAADRAKDRGDD